MQVYLITNTLTGQKYVGQTKWEFNVRYKNGNWANLSHNKHLKNAAKKYGVSNFTVSILCEGTYSEDELTRLEAFYMAEHNSLHPNGYNFKEAGKKGRNYYNHREYELIDHVGTRYQVSNLKQFCHTHQLSYGAMLNMVCGINTSSQGYALAGTDTSLIINPNQAWEIEHIKTGERFTVSRKTAEAFCQDKGWTLNKFHCLVNEKVYVSQGFKLSKTVIDGVKVREDMRKYRGVELVHDDGRRVTIDSVYAFAQTNDISRGDIYNLIHGRSVRRQGWRLPTTTDPKQARLDRLGKQVTIKNLKDGSMITIRNASDFCRQRGLDGQSLTQMISGTLRQYAYWTVPDRDLTGYEYPKKAVYVRFEHEDGRVVEGKNPKEIARVHKIASGQSLQDVVNGEMPSVKGWRVRQVRYLFDYYPEINR